MPVKRYYVPTRRRRRRTPTPSQRQAARVTQLKTWDDEADRNDTPAIREAMASLTAEEVNRFLGISRNAQTLIRKRMRNELQLPTDGRWAHIAGTDQQFCISSDGRACSNRFKGIWQRLRITVNRNGTNTIHIRQNGRRRNALVHQLVIGHFGPPRPSVNHLCRHWDDNKSNNDISNLLWGTQSENMRDAVRNKRNPRALSIDTARSIFAATGTRDEIAAHFQVPIHVVTNILARKTYSDFTRDLVPGVQPVPTTGVLSASAVVHIRNALRDGVPARTLATQLGRSLSTITNAAKGANACYAAVTDPPPTIFRRLRDAVRHLPQPVTPNPIEHGVLYNPGGLAPPQLVQCAPLCKQA